MKNKPLELPPQPQETRAYRDRLGKILQSPGMMNRIYAHVANGGDLISFAQNLDIRYSDIADWVTRDTDRVKIFTAAAEMGMEWVKRRILNELANIGLVDIRGIFNDTGGLRNHHEWPDEVARAIQGIEIDDKYEWEGGQRVNVGQVKKVKLGDKIKALELIGKEVGMFVQKHQVKMEATLEDLVGGSWEGEEVKT